MLFIFFHSFGLYFMICCIINFLNIFFVQFFYILTGKISDLTQSLFQLNAIWNSFKKITQIKEYRAEHFNGRFGVLSLLINKNYAECFKNFFSILSILNF